MGKSPSKGKCDEGLRVGPAVRLLRCGGNGPVRLFYLDDFVARAGSHGQCGPGRGHFSCTESQRQRYVIDLKGEGGKDPVRHGSVNV